MTATTRLWLFVLALVTVIICLTRAVFGDGGLVWPLTSMTFGLVSLVMNVARPYVFRGRP